MKKVKSLFMALSMLAFCDNAFAMNYSVEAQRACRFQRFSQLWGKAILMANEYNRIPEFIPQEVLEAAGLSDKKNFSYEELMKLHSTILTKFYGRLSPPILPIYHIFGRLP